MKQHVLLTLVASSLIFLTGCDLEYHDDGEYSSIYVRVADTDTSDIHTLVGGIEVVDDLTGFPVGSSEISVDIIGDGLVQDTFTVVTGPEGIARFEVNLASTFRPYDRLYFRVRGPGYSIVEDSIPIEQTAVFPDGNGYAVFLYEAELLLRLTDF